MSSGLSPLRINSWLSKRDAGKEHSSYWSRSIRGISPTPMIRRRWYRCFVDFYALTCGCLHICSRSQCLYLSLLGKRVTAFTLSSPTNPVERLTSFLELVMNTPRLLYAVCAKLSAHDVHPLRLMKARRSQK